MKKVFAILMLLVYFTVSTGFTVNLHYCMNKFHSWDLGAAKEKCGQCGMKVKGSSGCCHDEVKVVKLQQDLSVAKAIAYQFSVPVLQPSHTSFFQLPLVESSSYLSPFANGPPVVSEPPLFLRNCVFRL